MQEETRQHIEPGVYVNVNVRAAHRQGVEEDGAAYRVRTGPNGA